MRMQAMPQMHRNTPARTVSSAVHGSLLSIVAAVLSVCACSAPRSPDDPPQVVNSSPFGSLGGYGESTTVEHLSDIGIDWVRQLAVVWDQVDPDLDGTYDWDREDQMLDYFRPHDIQLMRNLNFFNKQDQQSCGRCIDETDRCDELRNPCDWEKAEHYLRAAITHLKDEVKYYQITNEPSGVFYAGTPEDLATLTSWAYKIIKKECPQCHVILGGMPDSPLGDSSIEQGQETHKGYFQETFDHLKAIDGCQNGCFDIFDMHTSDKKKTEDGLALDKKQIENVYEGLTFWLAENGFDKPIWSTEFGALGPQFREGGCEDMGNNGQRLIKSFVIALEKEYEKLFWRTAECPSWIIDQNGQKTPTYHAYKTLIGKIEGFVSVLKLAEGQFRFTFADKDPVYVAWCEDDEPCKLHQDLQALKPMSLTDYQGALMDSLDLSKGPVFAE